MNKLKNWYLKTNLKYNDSKIQDDWKTTINNFYNNFIEIELDEEIVCLKIIINKNDFYQITNKNNFKILVWTKRSIKLIKIELDKNFKLILKNKLIFDNNNKIFQNNLKCEKIFDKKLKEELSCWKIFDYNENLISGMKNNNIYIYDINNFINKEFYIDNYDNISPNIILNSCSKINNYCISKNDIGKIFGALDNGLLIGWDIEFTTKNEKYIEMNKIYDNKFPIISIDIFKKIYILIGDSNGKISLINYKNKIFIKSTIISSIPIKLKFSYEDPNIFYCLNKLGNLLIFNLNNLNKNIINMDSKNINNFKAIKNKYLIINTIENEFIIYNLNDLNNLLNNIVYQSPPNILKIKSFDYNLINNNLIIKGINNYLEIMNINLN